jgi:hypothetical protein
MKKHTLSKSPDSTTYQARDHNKRLVVFKLETETQSGAVIMISTQTKNPCTIREMRMGFTTFSLGLTNKGLMDLHLILASFIENNIPQDEAWEWQNEINESNTNSK